MAYEFILPNKTIIGENALIESMNIIKSLGKKALIVCGKVMMKNGTVEYLVSLLEEKGIKYKIYNKIIGEPTDKMIHDGVKVYVDNKCDFCIGIGGGSTLDSAKAIGAMTFLDGDISDYMGEDIVGDFPPLVLIPTTAGTGSEATKFTIITDTKNDIKMLLKGEDLLPDLAVIDYRFSVTAPKNITAETALDALTHAIESFTSRRGNTLTDMYALRAIQRIFEYLPIAYKDGSDKRARQELALAAFEAGVCINNSSVTLVHGMSRPIGAIFHIPHGLSNAMLLKECLSYALDGCYEKFCELAKCINVSHDFMTCEEASWEFIKALDNLCSICEIPTLKEYGIDKADFDKVIDKMAQDAIDSGSPSNTIKDVSKEDLIDIYKRLW